MKKIKILLLVLGSIAIISATLWLMLNEDVILSERTFFSVNSWQKVLDYCIHSARKVVLAW